MQNILTRKMCEQDVKTWEKKKNQVIYFSTLSIDDIKTKKKYKSVFLVQKYSAIAKTQQYLHNWPKGLQFVKKRL